MTVNDIAQVPKTEQGIVEFVLEHLKEQGEAAVSGGACCYRTEDGKACAVGCLIPYSLYQKAMDSAEFGLSVAAIVTKHFKDSLGYLLPHLTLLEELQDFHDSGLAYLDSTAGTYRLGEMKDRFDLTIPEWVPEWIRSWDQEEDTTTNQESE